jgi:hypothetical protein
MTKWAAFPNAGKCDFDVCGVRKNWAHLHKSDGEPQPDDPNVLLAWALFHSGEFQKATEAGLRAGGAGVTVANKSTCIYATYLEKKEKTRLDLYLEVAKWAQAQASLEPNNANAWYWHAYALGRYSQGISLAKALAQGIGGTVKRSLETTIQLQPLHADAHISLGAFHAEVIDKVGSLIGSITYGARKEVGPNSFRTRSFSSPGRSLA